MAVWITTSETATERTQRKVKAVRVEGGLAVTPSVSQSGMVARADWDRLGLVAS